MTTLLTQVFSSPFNVGAADLTPLSVNNGYSVSGGQAVSSSTTMSGSSKRFMLMNNPNWAGIVEADLPVQDQAGVCIGVPGSAPDGAAGVYFGVFADPGGEGFVFRLWSESQQSTGKPFGSTYMDNGQEARCWIPAGTEFTVILGARSNGWFVSINGKQTLRLLITDRSQSPVTTTRGNTRAGFWSTVSGAKCNRLVVKAAANRGFPTARGSYFYDIFARANGNWDCTAADIPPQAPLSNVSASSNLTIVGNQLSINSNVLTQLISPDSNSTDNNRDLGIASILTFKYVSGTFKIQFNVGGPLQIGINSSEPGAQYGVAYAGSDTKGGFIWGQNYATLITSGQYIQHRTYVKYDAAQFPTALDFAPYENFTRHETYTGTSISGPWTKVLEATTPGTGGATGPGVFGGVSICYSTPNNAAVIDEVLFERAPGTDFAAGAWPYDYLVAEGPLYSGLGQVGHLFLGRDKISQLVEAN